ncbi:NAD(P)-dependent oxidoreductase [Reyranella sp. CPCC 100927]|uniref:NAD(P)-dependent oxidoreductase n=1 Tax=Reyranella sp. CPCC 100927 TaxID=2599616 RepID=UPI0011B47572|nr:NAD(P)-binding domain-containing protein [Reyranella sp. CPCC 100927]TWS97338.1 NAD(P)-dependent oxidoreductase [Reyranella sp. CPCC 100927]
MSDVTVIGLGEMGSALARAFLAAGKSVVVWNRTPAKAAPLVDLGAVHASTVSDAVAASPVLVVCLSDYAATTGVLSGDGVAEGLGGRLIVQLTSGTPHQARALESWVAAHGAHYLDGAIAAWPRQIGGPDAGILIVGSEALFTVAEPLLKLLAGGLTYTGANIGHAKALFGAALAYFAAHWIGFSHGAAICEAEGLDVGMFGEMMAGMSPSFAQDLRHMGRAIAEDRFDKPEATLKTVSADVARLVELSHDLKIGAAFPSFAAGIFRRAVDAGFSAEEPCAIVKVLRRV